VKVHLERDPEYLRPLAEVMLAFEMPWSASVLRDFEERRASLAACGVFRLSDYLDEVVQVLLGARSLRVAERGDQEGACPAAPLSSCVA